MTLRSEPLGAEPLLRIVIMYLYIAAKRQDLFHIHLHKALLYCLRVEIDMHTHTHTQAQMRSLSKALPLLPQPLTCPAFTVDPPTHLSLVIAKKQGTICHPVCKCDHPLCHLKYTHTYAHEDSDTDAHTYI